MNRTSGLYVYEVSDLLQDEGEDALCCIKSCRVWIGRKEPSRDARSRVAHDRVNRAISTSEGRTKQLYFQTETENGESGADLMRTILNCKNIDETRVIQGSK